MGLDCETDRQAKDAGRHKSFLEETPDGYHAKAYSDSRSVAGGKDKLTVGEQDANQEEGDARRITGSDIPNQACGKDEYTGNENQPNRLRHTPWQQRKGSDKDECGGQVYKESHHLMTLDGFPWAVAGLGSVNTLQLTDLVWVVVF